MTKDWSDFDPICRVNQKASDLGDKFWVKTIPLQFTAKDSLVHGVRRLGKIELDDVNIIRIDCECDPFLKYKMVGCAELFGNRPTLRWVD